MNNKSADGIPWSFWVISVVALLWNLMGGINYFMQMNAEMVASFPDVHRAVIEGRPVWATVGFAFAVFGGTLGGLLLLLRKSLAYCVFIASLLGTIVTMIHTINIAISNTNFNFSEMVMMVMMPVLVAVLLVWYSWWARRRGWIR